MLKSLVKFTGRVDKAGEINAIRKLVVSTIPPHSNLKNIFDNQSLYRLETIGNKKNVLIGNISMGEFVSEIKKGKLDEAFHKVDSKIHIDENVRKLLMYEIKDLPGNTLHKIQTGSKRLNKLSPKLNEAKSAKEVVTLLMTDPKLGKVKKHFLSPTFKRLGYTALLVGGGLSLAAYIDRYRKAISGCIRYENVNGQLKVCKVHHLSCRVVSEQSYLNLCKENVLPEKIKTARCLEEAGGRGTPACAHCDSEKNDPPTLDINVEYRCIDASWTDALADMLGKDVENVVAFGSDAFGHFKNIFRYLYYGLIFLGGVGILGLAAYLVKYFRRSSSDKNISWNDEHERREPDIESL